MTRLTKEQRRQLLDPPTAALIAFHLNYGNTVYKAVIEATTAKKVKKCLYFVHYPV